MSVLKRCLLAETVHIQSGVFLDRCLFHKGGHLTKVSARQRDGSLRECLDLKNRRSKPLKYIKEPFHACPGKSTIYHRIIPA